MMPAVETKGGRATGEPLCYERFEHKADTGVRGYGPTKNAAFEQAALALTSVVCDPAKVRPVEGINIHCKAPDEEILLFEWLNAVVFQMSSRKMVFSRFEVSIEDHYLSGRIWGEKVEVERHEPVVEVKGATFTELKVRREPEGGWIAQCVVDV